MRTDADANSQCEEIRISERYTKPVDPVGVDACGCVRRREVGEAGARHGLGRQTIGCAAERTGAEYPFTRLRRCAGGDE